MNAPANVGERLLTLGPALGEAPALSVAIPFYKHDPAALLARLGVAPSGVEIVLLDDGAASAEMLSGLMQAAERLHAPVRIVVWAQNGGRASARNRLIAEARGEYVLFLDADMAPESPRFLSTWLGIIRTQRPFVAFGGLSLHNVARTPETALHHALFARSDCRSARERMRSPAQFTATSNLLVRRDFLAANPFDAEFAGWGFEDVDWALSAAKHAPILHVDNTAAHTGLDSAETLLRKFAEAGPNFARLARKHPSDVSRFAAHRVARLLRWAPARNAARDLCAWLARDPRGATPMALRCAAAKLYRAAHYAEHLT